MKTAKQILVEKIGDNYVFDFDGHMTPTGEAKPGQRADNIVSAMDEFAKEDAMSFMKWTFDHKWVPNSSFLWWNTELPREDVRVHKLEEIYKAYLGQRYQQEKSSLK